MPGGRLAAEPDAWPEKHVPVHPSVIEEEA
jgi:hypothetical protein